LPVATASDALVVSILPSPVATTPRPFSTPAATRSAASPPGQALDAAAPPGDGMDGAASIGDAAPPLAPPAAVAEAAQSAASDPSSRGSPPTEQGRTVPPAAADATLQSATSQSAALQPAGSIARRGTRPVAWRRTALVLVTAAAPLAMFATFGPRQTPAPTPRAATAGTPGVGSARVPAIVLPVEVHADAEWEWLRLGLMDLIANRLREGGIVTLDSQSVYPLIGTRPDLARARPDAEQGLSALSSQRIYASAWNQAHQWHVRITSVDDSRRVDASGAARDVTAAARLAADNLLISLGRPLPSSDDVPASVQDLLERTNVALLANRPEQARTLIASASGELREDVRVQVRMAEVDIRTGQLAAARTRLQPLLARLAEPGLELVRARALNDLALIAAVGAAPREATPLLDEASRLADRFDSPADLARTLQLRALQESALGRPEDALVHLAKARVMFEAAGDPLRVAGAELQAGGTAANVGHYGEALQYLTRAEATFNAFAARDQLAFARAEQVTVRLALLENAAALTLSDSYWPPDDSINNDRTRLFLTLSRAYALLRNGRLSEAETLFARVLAQADAPQHTMASRNATLGIAEAALKRGAFSRALELVLPLAHTPMPDESGATARHQAWHLAIEALRRSGDTDAAHRETTQFSAWAEALDAPLAVSGAVVRDARFYAALDRACDEAARNETETALARFAALFAAARELQAPERIVHVAAAYVQALIAAGRIDEASSVAGIIAIWADGDPDAAWAQAQVYRALGETSAFRQAVARLHALAGERISPQLESTR